MERTEMKAEFLTIYMVRKDFIQGKNPSYSYEDYLRDFVNCSEHFLKRSNGKPYRKPDSEAQGECDCISDEYAIDFKLFTSQSRMYTAKIFSPSIEVTDDWISYGMPEKHEGIPGYKKEKYSNPYIVFRSLGQDEIMEIRKEEKKTGNKEKDTFKIIKKFETKKNLMMFFPYNLHFDSNDDFGQGMIYAVNGINTAFKGLFQYRKSILPEYDTYVSFIYEKENFVITKWTGDKLEFVEMIPVYRSSLYCELWHIAEG